MKIDRDALYKVAHLARVEIRPEEEEAILKSMDSVLNWMNQLNEIDTEGVEPLTHISDEVNAWRSDEASNTLTRPEALANAPLKNERYIMVPKVIE
ncbi:Asp-tRNA(Asn)/Glu-tRNA(Gln) amidotransferase subunit GatC [Dyadobacter aurulentus]|uniref:Asp-tRNA(Asn)/Glu-tRNA(Gln) amidotransferase subunit GatC n=1 Tax=Dyadobacter sp. UC 10 TaxID=2605428 RepID=UPI0011F1FC81|nr:Asp-tRNA(Asn)/Glu-tRNA(Gln) amidotransferase subunit GatC [Dyadobacter sp. UC 10]KAA0990371.1 Asp-tRNA(Asn)/Glu-tRNA(Gln) amidotransferase subunit GatC [Dyadobacter sp. UC 10]